MFYSHNLDLTRLNSANFIMVPKCDKPETVGDYQLISVINQLPKLISKILANRLSD
jgi:hypothetical protein